MRFDRSEWRKIGEIGVDAGLCWVGDPCYILHKTKKELPTTLGKDWGGFCDKLDHSGGYTQFNYSAGHPGLGVVVSTGYGDGVYPVYIKYGNDGRVAGVYVDFMDQSEEDDD